MRVTKSYNQTPKGIQLEFDPELSNTDLKEYLISIGFKNANRNKGVWYIRGVRPSFDKYTSALENANTEGKNLLEVKIEPSYEASISNIDHKLFSLVTASIKYEDQNIKDQDYVVFEDFRVSAEDIATRFLTFQLGDKFKGLKVTAKNFKEKARNAFDEGRIITGVPESNPVKEILTDSPVEQPIWQIPLSVYVSKEKPTSEEEILAPEFLAKKTHEHKVAILTALRNGKKVSDAVLQDHPELLKTENFQFGFDATNFRSIAAFKKILNGIGNKGDYTEGREIDGDRSAYLWEGDNLKIVTTNNPLVHNGYASSIGIEGFREQVLDLVNLIEGQTDSIGSLGLEYIAFEDYDFSKPAETKSLTNENGVYTEDTATDRYEVLSIPFAKNIKFEASIKLVRDAQDQYVYGLSVINMLSGWSGYSFSPSTVDPTYPTREEALEAPILQILDGLQYEHTEMLNQGASEALKKAYTKTILAIYDFAENIPVKLPEERAKAILSLSIEKEESTKKEQTKEISLHTIEDTTIEINHDKPVEEPNTKHSNSKRATVQSMIKKLTDLEMDTEGETQTIIATFRLELEEALQIENEVTFTEDVTLTIKDQKDWINDIEPEAVRNTFLDLILSNAAALGYTPFTVPHSSGYILEQAWTKLDSKTIKEFEEFINSRPELLEHKYYPDQSEPHGLVITSDRDQITFQILKNTNIAIGSHKPIEEGLVYGGSTMSMTKLKKAIRYMLSNPGKVILQQDDTEQNVVENKNPVTTDIKRYGKTIPNVLSPYGVTEFFHSGLYVQDAKKVQKIAPYLLKASDSTLSELTAKELFELIQMAHPQDYGFAVSRSAMLREWEKRGQQVFEDLGFPTDANYPYVNINSGYRSVYPLQSIIGGFDKPQNWWSAANNYRPIGDLEKALEIIEEQKAEFKTQQLIHTNPKTGAPKSKKEDKEAYQQIQYKMEDLDTSKELITSFLKEQKRKLSTPKLKEPKPVEKTSLEEFFLVKPKDTDRIRKEFVAQGFPIPFTGQEAFRDNLPIFNLAFRWHISYSEFEKKQETPINKKKSIFTAELSSLEGKIDTDSLAHKEKLKTTIHQLDSELETARDLLEKENWIFQDELFAEAMKRVREKGCHPDAPKIAQFYDVLLTGLVGNKVMDTQDRTPVLQKVDFLIDDFLMEHSTGSIEQASAPSSDYLDKVIAIMHDHYIDAKRLSRKQIEAVQQESEAPNLGVLWEAVELSWLLWYQQIYNLPIPFERRLNQMMEFWNTVQPTYAYSDSSKELFKQYSTPCPIGAMIAEYTNMSSADRTFEPSAGNGLLVLGADPKKTHVNEIDKSRRYSLKAQGFDTITHRNAAEPFPEEWTHSFDVMVTNPPFASWDDSKFDKERWTQKYFNNQIGVAQHMRLEHFMAGLALHTLKDSGKAAIIIMGHVYFGSDGYIEKYKPFFNWLYRHYHVEDIINMNSYKLYNKQGAVTKTMLILIHGRKEVPEGIAPTKRESPTIEQVVNSFQELWERIDSHIKKPVEYSLQVIITQLKIELGL